MRYDVLHDRVQLWNTNTPAFVSCDADLTENYMYIYTTKGTSSPILRRSEEDRVKLCDMKT